MGLAVQLGVKGAEGWQSCRCMECVWVYFKGGAGGCMHARVAMHAPVGLISKQQGRD